MGLSLATIPVALAVWPAVFQDIARRIVPNSPPVFPSDWTWATAFLAGSSMIAATFAAIAVHEGGHVLVGICAGFAFNSLRIGPLQFYRRFRISLYRGKSTGASGWASMFPVRQDKLVLRAVAMLLAGPGANLLSAWALLRLPFSQGFFSVFFVYISLLLGLLNLLPFRSKAFFSDGRRILMLLGNREQGERSLAIMKLSAELIEGVMPESWSPGYLAKVTALRDNSPDTVIAYALAYSAAFHQHKDDEAAECLETCLRYSGYAAPLMRQALMTDACVFQARRRKCVYLAKQWLAAMPETTEIPWLHPQAEAGVFEAQGDTKGALKKLDEAENRILAAPNQAQREISLRFLQRWKSELQAQLVAPLAAGTGPATPLI